MQLTCYVSFFGSIALVFLGDLFYGLLNRKSGGPTNFQRFLFGTGFAYIVTVTTQIVLFFIDYFVPGSALQGFERTAPDEGLLFFRFFGQGVWPEAGNAAKRYALMSLSLTFFYMMLGAAVGGTLLLLLLQLRSRGGQDGKGLLHGYRFQKRSPGAYLKAEWKAFRAEIPIPEYLLWWAIRGCMVYGIWRQYQVAERQINITVTMMLVNMVVTFVVPLVRFVCFPKLFFGKIPFRVQTWINIFVFTGSFLGHGLEFTPGTDFDKVQHIFSGGLTIFVGYELIRCTRDSEKLSKVTKVLGATGFAYVVMIVWEVFEFISDFFIRDSFNQGPDYQPEADWHVTNVFYKVFGYGAGKTAQYPVFDTNLDIFYAMIGCAVCIVLLSAYLVIRERKAGKRQAEVTEKEPAAATA